MWLLDAETRSKIERAQSEGYTPTAEQQAAHVARFGSHDDEAFGSRILAVAGDRAEISVRGVLTQSPSFLAMIFGGGNTTYAELTAAIGQAEQNPAVKSITLAIDSPGGEVAGLFDALAVVEATKKPTTAVVYGMATSAAYAIAARTDRIEARNRASTVGSIGVAISYMLSDDILDLASTEAPKKRPDLSTEEGRAVVVEYLDALHELFVESIAAGRGTTVEKVNAEYGRGAVLLADKALERGMIDSIASAPPLRAVSSAKPATASAGGKRPESSKMNLAQLKAEHPDLFAEVAGIGANQERDRVTAHLTMGEASGDMATAVAAVNDGSAMTATLQAKYMAAGMSRRDIEARGDDEAAASAADGAAPTEADEGANVAAAVEKALGLDSVEA